LFRHWQRYDIDFITVRRVNPPKGATLRVSDIMNRSKFLAELSFCVPPDTEFIWLRSRRGKMFAGKWIAPRQIMPIRHEKKLVSIIPNKSCSN
jgi:hypothetical protein